MNKLLLAITIIFGSQLVSAQSLIMSRNCQTPNVSQIDSGSFIKAGYQDES